MKSNDALYEIFNIIHEANLRISAIKDCVEFDPSNKNMEKLMLNNVGLGDAFTKASSLLRLSGKVDEGLGVSAFVAELREIK